IAVGACVGLAWWLMNRHGVSMWRGRGGAADDATSQWRAVVGLGWGGLISGVLAFSPQTTGRHMVMLLFIMTLAGIVMVFRPRGMKVGLVIAGVVICVLGLILPPGGKGMEPAQMWWRAVGGAAWCLLALYFTTLNAGLAWAARLKDGRAPYS